MRRETLIEVHPELYHMADPRNFGQILRRGLLSTSALLDLYEIRGDNRSVLESAHRPESIAIEHPAFGRAILRDQKPMSHSGVERSVTDATPEEFFRFLSGRVFFWLTIPRLVTMNSALAYRGAQQVVFVVETGSLINVHSNNIRLSPMNSGATKPMPHERSIEMFRSIEAFDWEMKRPKDKRVVELTVTGGVPDVMAHVTRIEVWESGERISTLRKPYREATFA